MSLTKKLHKPFDCEHLFVTEEDSEIRDVEYRRGTLLCQHVIDNQWRMRAECRPSELKLSEDGKHIIATCAYISRELIIDIRYIKLIKNSGR